MQTAMFFEFPHLKPYLYVGKRWKWGREGMFQSCCPDNYGVYFLFDINLSLLICEVTFGNVYNYTHITNTEGMSLIIFLTPYII